MRFADYNYSTGNIRSFIVQLTRLSFRSSNIFNDCDPSPANIRLGRLRSIEGVVFFVFFYFICKAILFLGACSISSSLISDFGDLCLI